MVGYSGTGISMAARKEGRSLSGLGPFAFRPLFFNLAGDVPFLFLSQRREVEGLLDERIEQVVGRGTDLVEKPPHLGNLLRHRLVRGERPFGAETPVAPKRSMLLRFRCKASLGLSASCHVESLGRVWRFTRTARPSVRR